MTENKHTPGPWHPDIRRADGSITVTSPGTIYIATLWTSPSFAKETLANAHLIAAGPDLVEALEDVIADLETAQAWQKHLILNQSGVLGNKEALRQHKESTVISLEQAYAALAAAREYMP